MCMRCRSVGVRMDNCAPCVLMRMEKESRTRIITYEQS